MAPHCLAAWTLESASYNSHQDSILEAMSCLGLVVSPSPGSWENLKSQYVTPFSSPQVQWQTLCGALPATVPSSWWEAIDTLSSLRCSPNFSIILCLTRHLVQPESKRAVKSSLLPEEASHVLWGWLWKEHPDISRGLCWCQCCFQSGTMGLLSDLQTHSQRRGWTQ